MPSPMSPNETAAALDGRGDLDLVLRTTTASSHGEDNGNDDICKFYA